MLPTIAQYKKWSLPAKYSFWGLILAILPITISIRDLIVAVPDYAVIAFNYGTSEMTIYGGEGDSPDTAVIIRGANSAEAGISAEYYWISRRYPGYQRTTQAVIYRPEPGSSRPRTVLQDAATGVEIEMTRSTPLPQRSYDVLMIRNRYGFTRKVFFDVTTFTELSEPRPGGLSEEEALKQTYKRLQGAIKEKARINGVGVNNQ